MPPVARKTTATRKPAAKPAPRTRAKAKPAPVYPLTPTIEPIVITTADAPDDEPMVTLFTVDGVDYKIPARPGMNLALQLVELVEQHGGGMAELIFLRRVLGDDNFRVLSNCRSVTRAQIDALGRAVGELTLGALEDDGLGNG